MPACVPLGRAAMSDIRVAVLDDQPLSRAGAVCTLSAETDITIVGEGSSAEDTLLLATKAEPDVMLLAVNRPGDFRVMQDVLALCPDVKLVILSGDAAADQVRLAMQMGARGFVVEQEDHIRRLADGRHLITDANGMRYLVPRPEDLDPKSRRLLSSFS